MMQAKAQAQPLLESILVRGFRALRSVEWRPGRLAVLIGANGAGKSTVLEVVDLLRAAAAGEVGPWLNARRGFSQIAFFGGAGALGPVLLKARVNATSDGRPTVGDYELGMEPSGAGYVLTEKLTVDEAVLLERDATSAWLLEGAGTRTGVGVSLGEALLGHRASGHQPAVEGIRRALASTVLVGGTRLAAYAGGRMRQPMASQAEPPILQADGANLTSILLTLQEHEPDAFARVERVIQAAFPDVEQLHVKPVLGTGEFVLKARVRGARDLVPSWNLAEGVLRMLAIVTALEGAQVARQPLPSSIVLLDEPEVGLHPAVTPILVEVLRDAAATGTQVIVATHSADLVDQLGSDEVVVVEKDSEGGTTLRPLESDEGLKEWISDYRLGELWREGHLGGRA